MIKILFFARYREQLGTAELKLQSISEGTTFAMLKQRLIDEHGEVWSTVLHANNVVQAVNQTVADDNHVIYDGDEIAFFPPVTGG